MVVELVGTRDTEVFVATPQKNLVFIPVSPVYAVIHAVTHAAQL